MDPLTQEDLNELRCPNGCEDHDMLLTANCHPQAGFSVGYRKDIGSIIVACAECGKGVTMIKVAANLTDFKKAMLGN